MIKPRSISIIIYCLLFPLIACAQPYYFNHYQINDGLSHNAVICSMQDSYGFIWFGTKDGLNRFDGHSFKHFAPSPTGENSYRGNNIISLKEDFQKRMWVGTDQGIYHYNPINEQFRLLSKQFENTEVPVITTDGDKGLWFLSNGSLYHYNLVTRDIQQITQPPLYITSIISTKNGDMLFGTPDGKIYKHQFSGEPLLLLDLQEKFGSKDWFSIEKMMETRASELLIGTSKSGVLRYNTNTKQLKSILGPEQLNQFLYVRDMLQPNDREYWFATESGLFIYQIDTQQYINLRKESNNPWAISDNAIYNILQDKDEGIWLGTYFGGVNYYHQHNSIIEKIQPEDQLGNLKGVVVRLITKDQYGTIWIGTENGGLTKLDPRTNQIQNFNNENSNIANNNIHGILPIQDKLLLGTFVNGLDIFDIKQQKVIQHLDRTNNTALAPTSNFIFYMYETRDSTILVASTRGLYRFDMVSRTFHPIKTVPNHIFYTTLLEDSDGNIWVGTWRDGLFCYNPKTAYLKHYTHQQDDVNSLPNNRINSLFEDSKKQIWVATEGGMAKKETAGDAFEKISITEGMPSNVILSFLEDKQENLWVSTSKGLVRYHLDTGRKRIFNLESGLPTVQFNYNSSFDDGEGNFYFGSINGLIRFNPQKLNAINYDTPIPIYITDLTINNQVVDQSRDTNILSQSILFTEKIKLKHDESSFSVDFAALHFQAPHSIHYSYKMEGMDENWITIGNNHRAYFTKLSPGKYTFTIKAEDPNGNSIPTFRTLKIQILPPMWASTPAFILYALIVGSLVAFIIYHFNEKIKQRNRQHLLTVQSLREQEMYKSKINFYTDVAHEIRTPLTLIKAPLEKLMDKIEHTPAIDKLLLTMQKNTDKLIALSNQLLDFRQTETEGFSLHFEKYNISQLVQDIVNNFALTIQVQQKKLHFEIQADIVGYIDADAFDKICNNLLNNALKYSSGHIVVSLEEDKIRNLFLLTIKNDGPLIPIEERTRIFEPFNRLKQTKHISGSGLGLALTLSLTQKHQGNLIYIVDSKQWNTFMLTLPLNHNNKN